MYKVNLLKICGFISYAHSDGSELASGLVNYLMNLIPSFDAIYDERVSEGSRLEDISERLIQCDILIVIITPSVLNSSAVSEEIQMAKKNNMKIIPCKDKYIQRTWRELPWSLEDYKGFEFENPGELKRKVYASVVKNLENQKEFHGFIPKAETKKSEITELEIMENDPTNGDLTWEKYTIESKKKNHKVMAAVQNGAIKKIIIEGKSCSLLIGVSMSDDGFLRIISRRELIDSTNNHQDSKFIVLVDGEEIAFDELSTSDKQRILQVDLSKHSENIQVIGTEVEGISYLGEAKKENIVKILYGSTIKGDQFLEPETLTVRAGDTVKWINDDSVAHTITGGDPLQPKATYVPFNSGALPSTTSFSVTFNEPGIISYFDILHPWIRGEIIVNE